MRLKHLTTEQIKYIANLISDNDFMFNDLSITIHTDECIEIKELFEFGKQQQIKIYENGKVLRREYNNENGAYFARPIHNVMELGSYLKHFCLYTKPFAANWWSAVDNKYCREKGIYFDIYCSQRYMVAKLRKEQK